MTPLPRTALDCALRQAKSFISGGTEVRSSPVEGNEFELPVPRAIRRGLGFETSLWPAFGDFRRRQSQKTSGSGLRPKPVIIALGRPCIARGTGSSNPPPSSGESGANLTFSIGPPKSCWRTRVCRSPGTSNGRCSASLDRLSQDQLRLAKAATTLDYITGTAVLEFGPAETLSPVGAMSPAYPRLCRPRGLPWPAHSREEPGFSTAARHFPRETDCLLEESGFELLVPP
jgi:hypothetical protein